MVKQKLFLAGFLMMFLLMAISPASAAVELDVTKTAFDDMSLVVHIKGLTDGTTYYLTSSPDAYTTNTTEVTWVADSSGENTFFISTSTPSDKTLELAVSTTENSGATSDNVVVYYPDDDDVVNSDAIVNYIILVALIVIPVLLVAGIMRGFR